MTADLMVRQMREIASFDGVPSDDELPVALRDLLVQLVPCDELRLVRSVTTRTLVSCTVSSSGQPGQVLQVPLVSEHVVGRAHLMFLRPRGPAFTEREQDALELLRPHLQQVWSRLQRARAQATLTRRQEQVVRLLGAGFTNAQIAHRLGISEGTVRKHLEQAYARLGVGCRSAAAVLLSAG